METVVARAVRLASELVAYRHFVLFDAAPASATPDRAAYIAAWNATIRAGKADLAARLAGN